MLWFLIVKQKHQKLIKHKNKIYLKMSFVKRKSNCITHNDAILSLKIKVSRFQSNRLWKSLVLWLTKYHCRTYPSYNCICRNINTIVIQLYVRYMFNTAHLYKLLVVPWHLIFNLLFTLVHTFSTIKAQPSLLTSAEAVGVSTCFTISGAVKRTVASIVSFFTSLIDIIEVKLLSYENIKSENNIFFFAQGKIFSWSPSADHSCVFMRH